MTNHIFALPWLERRCEPLSRVHDTERDSETRVHQFFGRTASICGRRHNDILVCRRLHQSRDPHGVNGVATALARAYVPPHSPTTTSPPGLPRSCFRFLYAQDVDRARQRTAFAHAGVTQRGRVGARGFTALADGGLQRILEQFLRLRKDVGLQVQELIVADQFTPFVKQGDSKEMHLAACDAMVHTLAPLAAVDGGPPASDATSRSLEQRNTSQQALVLLFLLLFRLWLPARPVDSL